jgi:hypothetical protein
MASNVLGAGADGGSQLLLAGDGDASTKQVDGGELDACDVVAIYFSAHWWVQSAVVYFYFPCFLDGPHLRWLFTTREKTIAGNIASWF